MVVRELWKISFYKRKFWIEIIFKNSHKKVEHIENNLWDAPATAGDRASNFVFPLALLRQVTLTSQLQVKAFTHLEGLTRLAL